MDSAHLQCITTHYGKFEYNGVKTIGVTDYTNSHPLRILDGKNLSSTPVKMRKYLPNVHKIKGAHFQCVINHYAKFEYIKE